jgi:hypothetical protein
MDDGLEQEKALQLALAEEAQALKRWDAALEELETARQAVPLRRRLNARLAPGRLLGSCSA